MQWEEMIGRHPRCHIVTGYSDDPVNFHHVRLLRRLIIAMHPRGDWAIRATQEGGRVAVQVAFEVADDAAKLGNALDARRTGQEPGWDSQRTFSFGGDVAKKIELALG